MIDWSKPGMREVQCVVRDPPPFELPPAVRPRAPSRHDGHRDRLQESHRARQSQAPRYVRSPMPPVSAAGFARSPAARRIAIPARRARRAQPSTSQRGRQRTAMRSSGWRAMLDLDLGPNAAAVSCVSRQVSKRMSRVVENQKGHRAAAEHERTEHSSRTHRLACDSLASA